VIGVASCASRATRRSRAAWSAGLEPDALVRDARSNRIGRRLDESLAAFERDGCPGIPTWVVAGERYWGKDRVDWLAARVAQLAGQTP
jgi:2-hydroxychromene-2-carboxylate isomerase